MEMNEESILAWNIIEKTSANLFLTGKAGTGKTTFLKRLKELSPKRMIVLAPTGIAAINAGGMTIHSFFQLPLLAIRAGHDLWQRRTETLSVQQTQAQYHPQYRPAGHRRNQYGAQRSARCYRLRASPVSQAPRFAFRWCAAPDDRRFAAAGTRGYATGRASAGAAL